MAIKTVYDSGFTYNPTQDQNPVVPAIVDVVQGESQMANPTTDVVWDSGLGAAKFFMDFEHPTQTGSTIAGRTEQTSRYPHLMEAEQMWFSASHRLPASYADDPEDEVIYQWHVGSVGGSPNFSIRIKNGRFVGYIWIASGFENQMAFDIGPVTRDTWHNFVIKLKMHPTDGELTVWKDGKLARCHNPVTGEEWTIPTAPPGGGVTTDYVAYPELGAIQQTHNGTSLLVWNGKTARGTYPNPTKYPKWGFYKSIWGSRYNSNLSIKPEAYDPESPLYVAPSNRQKTIYIKNVNFETRLSEFTNEEIYQSLDVEGDLPVEIPNWWGADYSGPWHVSNSGSDINNGSEDFPFSTVTYAHSVATPGDEILLERGSIFYENFTPQTQGTALEPITFGVYGDENLPLSEICGGKVLTGWTSIGNGLYKVTDIGFPSRVNVMVVNNTPQGLGIFPKQKGGYPITSGSGGATGTISDSVNLLGRNFVGGEVVARKWQWVLDRGTITAHSGSTLSFTGMTDADTIKTGWGYFVQNHRDCCTEVGDWCQEGGDIIMYFGANDPNDYDIKCSYHEQILFNDKDHNHFYNIRFTLFNSPTSHTNNCPGIATIASQGVKFFNCEFQFFYVIFYPDATNNQGFELNNCTILDTLNIVYFNRFQPQNHNYLIKDCLIDRTGLIPGAGGNGSASYSALVIPNAGGTEGNILGNRILNTGYNGININGTKFTVDKNYISHANLTKDDGGGIYSYGRGQEDETAYPYVKADRKITNNIITNVFGAPEGRPSWFSGNPSYSGEGLYMDDNARQLTIQGNICFNNRDGLKLHNVKDIDVLDNIFYDNSEYQVVMPDDTITGSFNIRGINFSGNILYADAGQGVMHLSDSDNEFDLFGTFNNNYYMRPSNESDIISAGSNSYSLSQWKSNGFGYDQESKGTPTKSTDYEVAVNDTFDIVDYTIEGDMIDVDGNEVTGTIELDPYTATLLLAPSDVPPVEEYTVTVIAGDGGSVSGGGTYQEGSTASIEANPNTGWHFARWSNNVTDNPYSFTVTGDVTLQAIFEQDDPIPSVIVVKGKFKIV